MDSKKYFVSALGLCVLLFSCSKKVETEAPVVNAGGSDVLKSMGETVSPPEAKTVFLTGDQVNFKTLGPLFRILSEKVIQTRDSGEPVTPEYLKTCVTASTPTYVMLECHDLSFPHFASAFAGKKGEIFLLITEDGASVENRWVFKVVGDQYEDVTKAAWPVLDNKKLATLYTKAGFKNPNYTAEGLHALAHSSYRILHPKNGENEVQMMEAYPEGPEEAKPVAKFIWNGETFSI
jgi:hypothetical protein